MRFFFLSCLWLIACPLLGQAQQPRPSPTPPPDRPSEISAEEIKQFEESLKPYIEKARQTYPDARKRYLAGLPRGQWFSVTTKIYDERGRFEGVFIEVKEIKDGVIRGVIANDIKVVTKYKLGDAYTFAEKDLLDWTISHPDGTEEGNFVGKYIESLQKPQPTPQP
jgi:uncharacterized protein YegJ (DUF2314 family)